jgi:hypothetical protein
VSLTDDLRHALDPAIFATEVLGLDLDSWQAEVLQSTGKRDLLNCSRQAGKSTTAAVLGLHAALYRPGSLTLLVSPSLRQSSELFRKATDLKALLPTQPELLEDNKLSMSVKGGGRVVSLPGTEQTIRGFSGASLIVLDEAARVEDQLYYAVRPMLATSNGRLVGMSTPFGKRGWYWREWSEGQASWRKVQIPASQVPRISPAFLEEERQSMGDFYFRQEYLCEFVASSDSYFNYEDIQAALVDNLEPLFGGEDVRYKPQARN